MSHRAGARPARDRAALAALLAIRVMVIWASSYFNKNAV